jgi:hypothetical protein
MTIFLSAFLLFQVQPLIGKIILPWFGGTPTVWMTCMLFFQALLLGGYVYAHLLVEKASPRWQGAVHLLVLGAALLVLPIGPSETWKPVSASDPTGRILALLCVSVGTPFLILAATGPLIQSWFARRHPGRSPYRLYALSNAGSLLALLTYPFVFEPALTLQTQTLVWSLGFVLFVVLCGSWAWRLAWTGRGAAAVAEAPSPAAAVASGPAPRTVTRLLWLLLAASASALLLASTNQMTQNVAPVPFLWILPLSLYLLTFILCFDNERWFRREYVGWALVVALFAAPLTLALGPRLGLIPQIGVYAFTLFTCCMACHGELAALKPSPRHLTGFYLMIAAGGALGGGFVTLLAPRLFDALLEFPLALAASCLFIMLARRHDVLCAVYERSFGGRPWFAAACGTALCGMLVVLTSAGWKSFLQQRDVLAMTRNFYGVLQVGEQDADQPGRHRREMTHGSTVHGVQYMHPDKRRLPAAYYGRHSGLGLAMRHLREEPPEGAGLSIGVVGMGAGTISAFAEVGDHVTYYEINPAVVSYAERFFSYNSDAQRRGARVDVLVGDARLLLERQLARGLVGRYDMLVVDAFSSDAIPIHLLTEEAWRTYWRHLHPDGLLAVNVYNHYLELSPVVRSLAERHGMESCYVRAEGRAEEGTTDSAWVLVSDAPRFGESPGIRAAACAWPEGIQLEEPWTDDFSSLYPLLK